MASQWQCPNCNSIWAKSSFLQKDATPVCDTCGESVSVSDMWAGKYDRAQPQTDALRLLPALLKDAFHENLHDIRIDLIILMRCTSPAYIDWTDFNALHTAVAEDLVDAGILETCTLAEVKARYDRGAELIMIYHHLREMYPLPEE